MAKFAVGDLIVAHKVRSPRFNQIGWPGKVDKLMEVIDGEQHYGVSLWAYGADNTYCIEEHDIISREEWDNQPQEHWAALATE